MSSIPDQALEDLRRLVDSSIIVSDSAELLASSGDASVRSVKALANGAPLAVPALLVRPTTTEQVSTVLKWATEHRVPVTPRGLGSGSVGAVIPVRGGIVLDMAEFDSIGPVDEVNRMVTVGGGARLSDIDAAIAPSGLSCGHYPQSFFISSVAGHIAMRGSGTFSSLHGDIEQRIADMEIVLPTGEIVQTHSTPRASVGPDLKQLFIGSEGMFGVITKVTLNLVPLPQARLFNSARFDTFEQALESIRKSLIAGVRPAVVRIYDPIETQAGHAQFTEKDGWLLVLVFDGDERLVQAQEDIVLGFIREQNGDVLGPEPAEHWEQRRFNYSWSTDALAQPGGVAEAIEVSVKWSDLPAVYERFKEVSVPHLPEFMAHVSHVYDQGAALYAIVRGVFSDDDEAMQRYDDVWKAVIEATLDAGAIIGHHHGVGLERAPWMDQALGSGMGLLRTLKETLDPAGIMNPGKAGL